MAYRKPIRKSKSNCTYIYVCIYVYIYLYFIFRIGTWGRTANWHWVWVPVLQHMMTCNMRRLEGKKGGGILSTGRIGRQNRRNWEMLAVKVGLLWKEIICWSWVNFLLYFDHAFLTMHLVSLFASINTFLRAHFSSWEECSTNFFKTISDIYVFFLCFFCCINNGLWTLSFIFCEVWVDISYAFVAIEYRLQVNICAKSLDTSNKVIADKTLSIGLLRCSS